MTNILFTNWVIVSSDVPWSRNECSPPSNFNFWFSIGKVTTHKLKRYCANIRTACMYFVLYLKNCLLISYSLKFKYMTVSTLFVVQMFMPGCCTERLTCRGCCTERCIYRRCCSYRRAVQRSVHAWCTV